MSEFADLETLSDLDQSKGHDNREKFPCIKCSGTGRVSGGFVNRWEGKCYACGGKGYFLTSPQQRAKGRAQAKRAKDIRQEDNIEKYRNSHPAEVAFLEANFKWSGFYADMLENIRKYRSLTERQLAAVRNGMAKAEERKVEKAEREANAPVLDLTRINEMFSSAGEHLKKPALRVGNVRISVAPANGKNAGYLYVKVDGEYAGKISPAGKLLAVRSAPADLEPTLVGIASDPIGKLVEHGRLTGSCACCGRELTDPVSVARGIGPICADNWGL